MAGLMFVIIAVGMQTVIDYTRRLLKSHALQNAVTISFVLLAGFCCLQVMKTISLADAAGAALSDRVAMRLGIVVMR